MNVTWPTGTPDFDFGNPAGCWQSTSRAPTLRTAPRALGVGEEDKNDTGWQENRFASTDGLLIPGVGTRLFVSSTLGGRTIVGPGGYTVTTETDPV